MTGQQAWPSPYYRPGDKQVHVAYIWLIFLGATGAHRFYAGSVGMGVAYLLTLGFLGVGVFVDIFLVNSIVLRANERRATAPAQYQPTAPR